MKCLPLLLFLLSTFAWSKEQLPAIDKNLFKTSSEKIYVDLIGEMNTLIEVQKIKQIINDNENELFRELLGRAYLDIFNTKTGKQFCSAIIQSGKKIGLTPEASFYYFTNAKKSFREKYLKTCNDSSLEESGAEEMSQPALQNFMPKNTRTHTLFILDEKNDVHPLDSWSLKNNRIAIFCDEKDFTYIHLIKILVHELSITFDKKYQGNPNFFEATLQLSNDRDELCQLGHAIENPLIAKTLNGIRAFFMEEKIINELQSIYFIPNTISVSIPRGVSCNKFVIDHFLNTIDDLLKFVIDKNALYFAAPHLLTGCANIQNKENDFTALFQILFQTKLSINGESINACEFFIQPEIKSLDAPFNDGPRPRIKGGWKIAPPIEDNLPNNEDAEVSQQEAKFKAITKQLQEKGNKEKENPKNKVLLDADITIKNLLINKLGN
jgi:hypothetical protein